MKRTSEVKRSATKSHRPYNEYCGYTVSEGDEVLCVSDIAAFRSQFIDARRPVKVACSTPIKIDDFRLEAIVHTLRYDEPLQVERKVKYGFGSGKTREHLALDQIVEKLQKGDDSYYLTTQYGDESASESEEEKDDDDDFGEDAFASASVADDDEDSDGSIDMANLQDDFEDGSDAESDENSAEHTGLHPADIDFRVRSLYQPPLTNLVNNSTFPVTPAPFENLITQQINLWMGACVDEAQQPDLRSPTPETLGKYVPRGNSSGLHHDHADNLYVLVQGRKRFTLYSPKDADRLYTVGNINRVYKNGLIDYHVDKNARLWRPMREDGAIRAEWAAWALENNVEGEYTESQLQQMIEGEPTYEGEVDAALDPPSFSRIPPILAHLDQVTGSEAQILQDFADTHFPGFAQLRKLEVWLEPGEMLYIPTGWFHEVTSFASSDDAAHIALNWWFMPPSGSVENPYPDAYWKHDYEMTQQAIEATREATTEGCK